MKPKSNRWRFYVGFFLTIATLWSLTLYVAGRFVLNLRIEQIVGPASAFLLLFALSTPLVYWGRGHARREPADFRPLFIAIGLICITANLLAALYGVRLRVIQPQTAKGYAVTCLLGGTAAVAIAYYAHKNLYRKLRPR